MKVLQKSPDQLVPYEKNPKRHPASQIRQLCKSIETWGFTLPLLIDEEDRVIAGHGRLEAAKKLKLKHIPVVVATGWSDAKKRAYVIADNKLAELSHWNDEALKREIESLMGWQTDLNDLLGFTDPDIAKLLADQTDAIEVLPGEGTPGRKSLSCKVGSLKIACTGEERNLLVEMAATYEAARGMRAGFVGWLAQSAEFPEDEEDHDSEADEAEGDATGDESFESEFE